MTFTREGLERDRLPNIAFYPSNPMLGDPRHRSGVLSALYLSLLLPGLGRRFLSEAIRQSQIAGGSRSLAHWGNILRDAPATVRLVGDLVWQRFKLGLRKPFVFIHSKNGEYPLHYHSEQAPSWASAVRLSEERDSTGLRRLVVNLQFSPEDGAGIARAHLALDASLRRAGVGQLRYHCAPQQLADRVLEQARDGFHQLGLTRMGRNPSNSVVDANCRVHGTKNLYVAGSSVFRTGGQANPTFTAVALGLRLADHLWTRISPRATAA